MYLRYQEITTETFGFMLRGHYVVFVVSK